MEIIFENVGYFIGSVLFFEVCEEIRKCVMSVLNVLGVYDFRVYYVGNKFYVEFYIEVLLEIIFKGVYDISEEVKKRIEEMLEVERVFVYVDIKGVIE